MYWSTNQSDREHVAGISYIFGTADAKVEVSVEASEFADVSRLPFLSRIEGTHSCHEIILWSKDLQ